MKFEQNNPARGTCPFTGAKSSFTPFDENYWKNPYPLWKEIRKSEPVFYSPEINYWVVSRYDDIKEVLADTDSFSAEIIREPVTSLSEKAQQILKDNNFNPTTIAGNDPPGHTKIRKAINYAFTPKRVRQVEDDIRQLVNEYIDRFIDKGEADLVKEMFFELPADVLFIFLGFPREHVPRIKELAVHRLLLQFGKVSEERQEIEAYGLVEFWNFCKRMVEEVAMAEEIPDNFMGDLIKYRNGDDNILSLNEIASIVYSLLFAGHETTTGLAGNAIYTLLTERHVWEELCANPELIPKAVEEVLRYNTSVFYWRRRAKKDVSIGGVDIPAGANILLALGSSGHDENKFANADTFDIHRDNNKDHLGFGFGIHYCVGAPLARLDMKIILEELTKRMPNLRLKATEFTPVTPNLFGGGPEELWVTW